jgi:COP9 signalosome complex subunit 1
LRAARFDSGISNFVGISFSLASKWNEGLAAEDIALYGGVCALGALSRGELKRRVLDNAEFKRYLELRPDLLNLITAFYESEYGTVMEGLRLLRRELIVDPFTYAAVDPLLTAIRGKALVQYFSPYSVMDMNRMAEAFNVSQTEMERELSICIADGHINAKIDSHSKIVYAAKHDKRRKLFLAISKLGDDFERDIVGVLLRMSLQKENIAVSQTREILDRMGDGDDSAGLLGSMARVGGRVLGVGGRGRD